MLQIVLIVVDFAKNTIENIDFLGFLSTLLYHTNIFTNATRYFTILCHIDLSTFCDEGKSVSSSQQNTGSANAQ